MAGKSGQAIYRRWRPGVFAEVEGQQHIVTALTNAVRSGAVGHSYMFCGPKGTGKTTSARILAKAVNCATAPGGDACGQCKSCQSIAAGTNLDVIELDAASNRGIDEIREIRERVRFMPAQAKRKVYIIDEAHMLTQQASNAFLKTLEEPPAHSMFILCTTEAHGILPTIASRCQRMEFRRIAGATIAGKLTEIARDEEYNISEAAIEVIASESEGSLRDAENWLERVCQTGEDEVRPDDVSRAMGIESQPETTELTEALIQGDMTGAIRIINEAVWSGRDATQLHTQTTARLRDKLFMTLSDTDDPEAHRKEKAARIAHVAEMWLNGRPDGGTNPTIGMEIAAAKAAGPIEVRATPEERASTPSIATDEAAENAEGKERDEGTATPRESTHQNVQDGKTEPRKGQPEDDDDESLWHDTLWRLDRTRGPRLNIAALLRDCDPTTTRPDRRDGTLTMRFRTGLHKRRFEAESGDAETRDEIERAIEEVYGLGLKIRTTIDTEPAREPGAALIEAAERLGARRLSTR